MVITEVLYLFIYLNLKESEGLHVTDKPLQGPREGEVLVSLWYLGKTKT